MVLPETAASEPITPILDSANTPFSRSGIRVKEPQKDYHFARKTLQPVIWCEVEDFFRYFDHFCNPRGVQRVSFEICRAATTLDGLSERVRFCRLSIYSKRLHTVDFG